LEKIIIFLDYEQIVGVQQQWPAYFAGCALNLLSMSYQQRLIQGGFLISIVYFYDHL